MLKTANIKSNLISLLLAILSLLCYVSFAYGLERTDTFKLLTLYTALFFLFYKLIQLLKHNLTLLTWLVFGFRAIFILAIPNLSQDFYRFIWDGRMILEGLNPYLFTPESFIGKGEFPIIQAQELYNSMGTLNGSHFTNYPPLNQLCFVIAGVFAGKSILGSVVVMRLLIITADFGTLIYGKKLLEKLKLPTYHIFWYLLNPFIIIELTGNLHFEGIMIFFLIWSLYLLHISKWKWSAVILAFTISVKLIPLLFLPVYYVWFRKQNVIAISNVRKKQPVQKDKIATLQAPLNNINKMSRLLGFYSIVTIILLISFLPFYSSEFIVHFTETTTLWFTSFEFNASIYYIIRAIGYWFVDFNIITYYGWFIAFLIPLVILYITYKRQHKTKTSDLIITMLFVLSLYYFTATTVHPWYIATLLILSIFTRYKFALVWSFVVMLSYAAYSKSNYAENLWLVGLEYIVIYGVFIYEVLLKKPIKL
ncbi:MAG: mannosyltransferase [Flavobacteriaceae bacterium]